MIFAKRIFYPAVFLSLCLVILHSSLLVSAEASPNPLPPSLEEKVLSELNAVRKKPQSYIGHLWEYRKAFDGNQVKLSDGTTLLTKEGLVPVNEAIRELNEALQVTSLDLSRGLSKAARAHLEDLIKTNTSGHSSSDGTPFDKRLAKFGSVNGASAENITYSSKTQKDILMKMIIDDGTANRNHRKNVFNPKFKKIGIATGNHPTYGPVCVVIFAEGFTENRGGAQVF